MAELKSCPFCKGQNINIIACYDDACENVYCEGCDKVRYTVVCNAQRGGCGAICGWKATKEEAINAWNTRTPQKEVFNMIKTNEMASIGQYNQFSRRYTYIKRRIYEDENGQMYVCINGNYYQIDWLRNNGRKVYIYF